MALILKQLSETIHLKRISILCIAFFSFNTIFSQVNHDECIAKGYEEYKKGRYIVAEKYFRQAIDKQDEKNEINESYLNNLSTLAKIQTEKFSLNQADSLYVKALNVANILFGENSKAYINILNDYAQIKIEQYDLQTGVPLLEKVIAYRKRTVGENSLEDAESINLLTTVNIFSNRIPEADSIAQKSAGIRLSIAGEVSPEYAKSLISMGNVCIYQRDLKTARKHYTHLMAVNEKLYGTNHVEYAKSVILMSTLLSMEGLYRESIKILSDALPLLEENIGKDNIAYASALSNIGSAYAAITDYQTSITFLSEALDIYARQVGKQSHYYVNTLHALAGSYSNLGEYEKAESMYMEMLDLGKQLYGAEHPDVMNAMNSISLLYRYMGDNSKAERQTLEMIRIAERNLDKYARIYTYSLHLLAIIQRENAQWETGYETLNKVIKHITTYGLEQDPIFPVILSDLLQTFAVLEETDNEALEKEWIEAIELIKLIFGENSQLYYQTLVNYAESHSSRKNYSTAIDMYKKAIAGFDDLNIHNRIYFKTITILAHTYQTTNDQKQALYYYTQALDWLRQQIIRNFAFMSEKEREMYWNQYLNFYNLVRSLLHTDYPEEATVLLYDTKLFSKSILLNSNREIQQSILNNSNEKLLGIWDKTVQLRAGLIQLETLNPATNETQIETLNTSIHQLERELSNQSDVYKKLEKKFEIRWKEIQSVLKPNEAAIEFIMSPNINIDNIASEVYYYALVIRPEDKYPVAIKLCEEDPIDGKTGEKDNDLISRLIWHPLENYLVNTDKIYVSPINSLYSVSFNRLKDIQGNYLFEKYSIHHLLTTKDILTLKDENSNPFKNKTALLVGGADYGLSKDELGQADREIESLSLNLTRSLFDESDATRGQGFDYLPGSRKEVEDIEELLIKLDWETTLLVDKKASETRFKVQSFATKPEILHISTHGFYFPQHNETVSGLSTLSNTDNVYKVAKNPLVRSGLVFAGANHVWIGGETEKDTDDGILTAYEISNLNLSNTELVVLSACDTGLGDIINNEGVYGLQRAFRLAGVKKLLVALWKIPDKETVEMMTAFYKNLSNGLSIKQSFDLAQHKLQEKYPNKPRKWAGFVLIE